MIRSENERRLYNDLAHLWHLVSPLEDYLEETENICEILQQHAAISLKSLLHMGCGRGHNDYIFKRYFEVTGVDISPTMLEWARKLNPEIEYLEGDMRTFQLDRRFDVVTAVDSTDYLYRTGDLRTFFENAYRHLNPGGIFMFILDDTKETFIQNETTVYTNSSDNEVLTVTENKFDPDPEDTEYEMIFVYLYRKWGELEIFTDRHKVGLFPRELIIELLSEAGFEVRLIDYQPPEAAWGNVETEHKQVFPMFISIKPE